jgi:SAM-dependent methyltransferase
MTHYNVKNFLKSALKKLTVFRQPSVSKKEKNRKEKVFSLLDSEGIGLEIGPSHNPIAPKREGYNVHILDHASTEELREKYKFHNVNLENIELVDFVSRGEPYSELIGVQNYYDWIICSHAIEHIPDPILFLQQCEKILKPGGVLSLVIPDKRRCFDYFSPISQTGALLDAFYSERKSSTIGQIFDHFANAAKVGESIAWGSDIFIPDGLVHGIEDARTCVDRYSSSGEYFDVHCWRFIPESFRLIVSDLYFLELIGLKIELEFPTEGCEFFVSLRKTDRMSKESIIDTLSNNDRRIKALKSIYKNFQ